MTQPGASADPAPPAPKERQDRPEVVRAPTIPRSSPAIPKRSHQAAFAVGCVVVAAAVIYLLREVIGAFVLGALLAFIVLPAINFLSRRGVPRAAAIVLSFALVLAVVAAMISLFVPLLASEVARLQQQAPAITNAAQDQIDRLQGHPVSVFGVQMDLTETTRDIQLRAREFLLGQFGNAISLGIAALGTLAQTVLMLIVAFLIALDARRIVILGRRLVPVSYRNDFDSIVTDLRRMLFAYMQGQLVVAGMIGVSSGLAVWALGLDFALALGILAGITSLIPYLGPFLGALPAVLVALARGPIDALVVAVVYFVISNVILNFVYPKVLGDAVKLPPILIIIAFLAGFGLAGVLGMFIAVPIAAGIRILFEHVYPKIYGTPA